MLKNFVIFILSHARANHIITVETLRRHKYTGKIIIVIDDTDTELQTYLEKYGATVEIFNKKAISKTFDIADNFAQTNGVVYARNACFQIAKQLGYKYFMQLDDDYSQFEYRLYSKVNQTPKPIHNLDKVIIAMLEFYNDIPAHTIAMAQGGDFMGGKNNPMARTPVLARKCMNTFLCSTEKPFLFHGRINEDVNTYTHEGSKGQLMFTIPFLSVVQASTQSKAGGMTQTYMTQGTYVKSFYTVMFQPSSVTIKPMGTRHRRMHHCVNTNATFPKIISETNKK